jgi:hypothetical protein
VRSFFFGPDRVYHFDGSGGLRRAFVDGFLYRSEGSGLSRLKRERSENESVLMRSDLKTEETGAFLETMRNALGSLASSLRAGAFQVLRHAPSEEDVIARLISAIKDVLEAPSVLAGQVTRRRPSREV